MVIRFFGGTTPPTWQDQGMIAEVHAYWEALRKDGQLPRRVDIDPRGMARALENAFLIERIAAGMARFRIAGMILHQLAGMDVRGMPVSTLFTGDSRAQLQKDLDRLFQAPAKLSMELRSEGKYSRPDLSARLLILPVIGFDGKNDLALGCIEIAGPSGHAPRRFQISASRTARICLPEAGVPPAVVPRPAAETPAHVTPVRGRSHLRLVHSVD